VVDVRLVDLEVMARDSLAVRSDAVPAVDLAEAIDGSRALMAASLATESSSSQARRRGR